jgi:hypothetical protein
MLLVANDVDQFAFVEVEDDVYSSLADWSYLHDVAGSFLIQDDGLLLGQIVYLDKNISELGCSFKIILLTCFTNLLLDDVFDRLRVSLEKRLDRVHDGGVFLFSFVKSSPNPSFIKAGSLMC